MKVLLKADAETSGNGANTESAGEAKAPKLELSTLTYEVAVDLDGGQQDELMRSFNRRVEGLAKTREHLKDDSKRAAILLAGVEVRVKRGIEARIYPSTKTASEVYKDVTGAKPPGHVWTLKEAFVNYVLTGKITEQDDFIPNRGNCLELAQKIVNAVIEANAPEGLNHPAVTQAANELKTRTEKEAKNLRAILASVKPEGPMTDEEALEYIQSIVESGKLPLCMARIPELVKDMPEAGFGEIYVAIGRLVQNLDPIVAKSSPETVETWNEKVSAEQAPIQLTTENGTVNVPHADLAAEAA